jgi:DNA-binding transcriptional ArsR family regulator
MANEPATPDDVLRALANIHRLRILHALSDGALWVSDLQALLPLSQSALSQHLARLREAGIVATHRQGLAVAYRIVDAEALTLAEGLLRLVDRREKLQP